MGKEAPVCAASFLVGYHLILRASAQTPPRDPPNSAHNTPLRDPTRDKSPLPDVCAARTKAGGGGGPLFHTLSHFLATVDMFLRKEGP